MSRFTLYLCFAIILLIGVVINLVDMNRRNDPNFGSNLLLTLFVIGLAVVGIITRNKDAE